MSSPDGQSSGAVLCENVAAGTLTVVVVTVGATVVAKPGEVAEPAPPCADIVAPAPPETEPTDEVCAAGTELTPSFGVAVMPGEATIVVGDGIARDATPPPPPDVDAAETGAPVADAVAAPVGAVVDDVLPDAVEFAVSPAPDVAGLIVPGAAMPDEETPLAVIAPVGVRICAAAGVASASEARNDVPTARLMITGNGGLSPLFRLEPDGFGSIRPKD
jgi:hypothetical protein